MSYKIKFLDPADESDVFVWYSSVDSLTDLISQILDDGFHLISVTEVC